MLGPDLGIRVTAAHLNHGIRAAAGDADEAFVRRLTADMGVPLVAGRMKVPLRARNAGVSLEMAAREARYSFFARSARRAGADVVATAHTADDQAETVLLKLARGAGATGLSGIARQTWARGVRVVRPLLDVTHAEACAFLRSHGVGWREDETNLDTAFLRNRVRHEILPLMEKTLNPGLRKTLSRTADVLAGEDEWLTEIARAALADCREPGSRELSVSRLLQYRRAARRRVLLLWLSEAGVPLPRIDFELVERVDDLLKGRTGRLVNIGAFSVRRSYDRLAAVQAGAMKIPPEMREALPVPGEITLREAGLRIRTTLEPGIAKPVGGAPGRLPALASISKRAVGRKRIYVRFRRPGDRMRLPGMRGSRKLQDIFTDAKVPRHLRERIPVVECGGEIAWLPGYRVALGWEVQATERKAIQIRVEGI